MREATTVCFKFFFFRQNAMHVREVLDMLGELCGLLLSSYSDGLNFVLGKVFGRCGGFLCVYVLGYEDLG